MTAKLMMNSWPWRKARPKPASMTAGRNRALAKAISPWLKYICAGRVRLVTWLSQYAAAAISSSEIRAGVETRAGLMVTATMTIPASVAQNITQDRPRIWSLFIPMA